jgi:hypothetical protein
MALTRREFVSTAALAASVPLLRRVDGARALFSPIEPAASVQDAMDRDLLEVTIPGLHALYVAKKYTATQVTQWYLNRIAKYDRPLNSMVVQLRERAMARAKQADATLASGAAVGPLHGVPVTLKESFNIAGVPTTWGAAPYKDQVFDYDATIVTKLRDAGASTATAPAEYGSYTREEASYFIGEYVFARPSFQEDGIIQAFRMEIVWGPKDNVLILQEHARDDEVSPQVGKIHIPRGSTHIFVASNENGWVQTIILSQLNVLKRMQGVMLTMGHAFANIYSPVAVPVIMSKHSKVETRMVGRMAPGDPFYKTYQTELAAVEAEGFAKWVRVG